VSLPRRDKGERGGHAPRGGRPIRLDLIRNPYGATEHVGAVLASGTDGHDPADLEQRLRSRVSRFSTIPDRHIHPFGGIDNVIDRWLREIAPETALVHFPPGVPLPGRRDRDRIVEVHRGPAFQPELDAETASELPRGAIAYIVTPHDPSGALAPAQDIVRLARACSLVIVDQRHGGYTPRSLAALAREFDNVVILQTLETWAGLDAFPVGWAIGAPSAVARLGGLPPVAAGSLLAGMAVFDDLHTVLANARRVRDERSRLYRMLRKLNLVQPLPSWANFLLASVERSDRETIASGLAERGILVHVPTAPGLERFLRISAGHPEETDALREALVEISLTV
jgi:histidinol-phosphate/aromatic aminotransferase/cobyric acid decarboxylase-like protein